jgi:lysophospholipase L1-like esterase
LVLTTAIFVILLVEAWRNKRWLLAAALRGGLFVVVATELLLGGVDRLFVSRNPQSSLGGPYYEMETSEGTWVFLKKAHAGSPLGFRTDQPYKLVPDHRRILFLGDSYTEGSGRSSGCNYPTVVEKVLRDRLGDVEVMNAGVSGYGPLDALNLLRLLREQGYRFEAVVYNLFTENDFTDNLPNTDRRIVGGVIFRVPHSWFLRTFHPLNSYIFRYALVMWRLSSFSAAEEKQILLESGNCIFAEERHREVSAELRELIRQRLAGSQRVAQSKRAQEEFINTMAAMKAEADKLRIPLVVVVFPDRVIADSELRLLLELEPKQTAPLNVLHSLVYQAVPDAPTIEVVNALRGHSAMYRIGDTHLSDLGNKIAGEYVGEKLAALLATTDLERDK